MIVINVRASVPAGGSRTQHAAAVSAELHSALASDQPAPWLAYEDRNLTTLDSHDVWMVRRELSRILDDDDPFLLRHQRAARQAESF